MKYHTRVLFGLFLILPIPALAERSPALINAVVASVDGKPITLRDVSRRLSPPRDLSVNEAAKDPEAKAILDALIMEAVLSSEAEAKKISVSDDDVEHYVEEVARRNNLSKEGFEKALTQQNRSLNDYRNFVRSEITKSKLAGSLAQGGAGVSDDEVDQYLKQQSSLGATGNKLKLAQILISTSTRSESDAISLAEKARQRVQGGEPFSSVAQEMSESSEGRENGGLLGIVAEKDLQSDIFDAVLALKPGELSKVVKTPAGVHIFQVLERFEEDKQTHEVDNKLRDEVRRQLSQRKLENKMNAYFSADLAKAHSIDRKF